MLAYLRSVAQRFLHRSRMEDDLDAELLSHIQHRADDHERSGLPRAEAERLARIEFGGQSRFKEEAREEAGGGLLDALWQELRFGLRSLRKSRGFTLVAVATLAVAIAANTVVFGVMNALVLRPLNVPQSENLWGTAFGIDTGFQSYPNYLDLRDRNHSFEDLAAFNFAFVGLNPGAEALPAVGFTASGNYFDVLRVQPYLGRFFHPSDEHGPNSAPYIVLTYAYWQKHFPEDRGVIGRTLQLNKHPFTVIGVAPPDFQGTLLFVSPEFFIPMVNEEQADPGNVLNVRAGTGGVFETFGHLKAGVTSAQALEDLKAVGAYLERTYPKEFGQSSYYLGRTGLTSFGGPLRAFLTGLMLLAGLILLATCANLGGLFAAHTADRSREIALRLALGSGRWRIVRQLLIESVLISLAGGAAGVWISAAVLDRLSKWRPLADVPVHIPANPDSRVYLAALAFALVSGFLFGLAPMRQILRASAYQVIKAGPGARSGGRLAMRDLLLVGQIAICALLVTSSFVAVRGLVRSIHVSYGFEPYGTMLASLNLGMAGYTGEAIPVMQRRMLEAVQTIPGADRVGLINDYPPLVYGSAVRAAVFREETSDLRQANAAAMPYHFNVSPEYFATARTTLLAGRDFTWHDDKNSPVVAVVNRTFAIKTFGSIGSAVGSRYKLQDGRRVEVVGVVEDGKYLTLTEDPQPAMFLPFLQAPSSQVFLIVRSNRDPQELAAAIRAKVREMDAGLPVGTPSWNSLLILATFPPRVATVSLGVMGAIGAMLSITGLFGMAAYSVSKRMKEFGIRMALGARRKEVLHAALGRAVKLLSIGSAAGLVLGLLASRVLAFIVIGATPRDPFVLAGAVLVMLLLGLAATWIPARRALSVDPVTLLRED